MTETDEATERWGELTDDLISLTDKVKETYRRVADEQGPTEEEIRQALQTLAGAWEQVASSVGVAIQDPEVRAHLKKAATSLVAAVSESLSELAPDEARGSSNGSGGPADIDIDTDTHPDTDTDADTDEGRAGEEG